MGLVDGYREEPRRKGSKSRITWAARAPPPTDLLPHQMYGLIKGIHARHGYRMGDRAGIDPVHIWLVGNSDWLESGSRSLPQLLQGEHDRSYRELMIVAGLPPRRAYPGNWTEWAWQRGFRQRRRHSDENAYRNAGTRILGEVSTQLPGELNSAVLHPAWRGCPVTYYGTALGREATGSSPRIQQ